MARVVGVFLQESMTDMIRLQTVEDENTLVMKDGTLLSLAVLDGAIRTPGEEDIPKIVERLRNTLSPYLSQPGHLIDFNFLRDSDLARRRVENVVARTGRSAERLGLDIDDVLEERRRVLSRIMVAETLLIALYTCPDVLSPEELSDEGKALGRKRKELPVMVRAHDPAAGMDLVMTRHAAMVDAVIRAFRTNGFLCRSLDVISALREMHASLHGSGSGHAEDWTPILPEWMKSGQSKPCVAMPETPPEVSGRDFSPLFGPKLDRQLATEDSFIVDTRTVRVGNRIFSAFDMTVPPETLPEFNALVRDITAKSSDLPWRCSMRIEAGGMHSQALKNLFLSIFTFAAPTHNKRIRAAVETLREIDGQSDSVVRLRMSFSTWAKLDDEEMLRRNAQTLVGAVQRWGSSRADGISGDQLATVMSTMPGLTMASTAPVAAAPLAHALAMAPIARQASPWDHGAVLFRTDDGQVWPFQPGSSRQSTWVTLLVGTPGSGKSVMMNTMNFASAISPYASGNDAPALPRLAMIDIGPSSSGMISLIQEALPPERRHEALFSKLRMSRDHAVNVFDTQLGCRAPTANERQFLVNFLCLVCGSGLEAPEKVVRGLVTACVDRSYVAFSDMANPRRYLHNEEPAIDQVLDGHGFTVHGETSWWEVVDFLMEQGHVHEASLAQRHAVPVLSDLVTASQSEQVASFYEGTMDTETGQNLLDSFRRMVSEIVRDFPILSGRTRFSIGSARIVSLDLMDVTVGGASVMAKRQTALMYMLARHVLTRDFFLDEAEFRAAESNGIMPTLYLDHHVKRAKANLQCPKLFCMDEFHRTGQIPILIEQVLQDAREGRKFNVDIRIASQLIEDFPEPVIEIATGLLVCDAGSESSIDCMDRQFRLTESEKRVMRDQLTGPTRRGAPVWAMFRLKEEGMVRQKLTLTLGPAEIWAFSTTAEDVALRSQLYEKLGPRLTRRILARRFPGGSAKSEIEARIMQIEESGSIVDGDGRTDIISDLAAELESKAYLLEENHDLKAVS
ncbi:MAG: hypothetical protein F4213_05575 [Boseongicola sp. SB0677_bin_26]|nr:hypothetical protein [Boseongicola sp. SB0665_bin_10]MYG25476.1 hypothetical protein [Boseongicola sp. SB0677_bin_26]